MTKNNSTKVEPLSDNDLEMYAEWLDSGDLPEGGEKQIERIAQRVANLGDTSSIIRFMVGRGKEDVMSYLSMLIQRLSVMEFMITDKLGIGIEEMQAYNERYFKELAEAKARMTEDVEEEAEKDGE